MTITAVRTPGVRGVTIIRTDPLPAAGPAVQQAARTARFLGAITLLVVRVEVDDIFFTDVATSQVHTFGFDTTSNPVENGSIITDHVRRLPETLEIDGLIVDTPLGFPPTPIQLSRATKNFTKLLGFAKQRQPVLVATSLQIYESMLITRIVASRGVDSGSSIPVSISFREIKVAQELASISSISEAAAELGILPPTSAGPAATTPLS